MVARLEDEETRHGPIRYASGKRLVTGGMCAAPTGACFTPHTSFAPYAGDTEGSAVRGADSNWRLPEPMARAAACVDTLLASASATRRTGMAAEGLPAASPPRSPFLRCAGEHFCVLCASTQSISHACLWCGNSVDPDGITTSGGIRHRWKRPPARARRRSRRAGPSAGQPAAGVGGPTLRSTMAPRTERCGGVSAGAKHRVARGSFAALGGTVRR